MFKFLAIAIALFLLVKLFKGDAKKKQERAEKDKEKLVASGEMVKDPVCGTFVSKDADIRVKEGDKVHRFCSFDCRDKFLKKFETEKAE